MPGTEENTVGRKTLLMAAGVIGTLALVLQIVGCATPGWLILRQQAFGGSSILKLQINVGLWTTRYCINDVCKSLDIASLGVTAAIVKSTLEEFKIETIIGIISVFVAVVLTLVLLCLKNPTNVARRTLLVFSCIGALLSSTVAIIASGKFGNEVKTAHNALGIYSPILVPYSVIITGVGGILAAVLGILLVIKTCSAYNQRVSSQQGQMNAMATYSQSAVLYVGTPQNPGYPQPVGAPNRQLQRDAQQSGYQIVSKSPPPRNYHVTRY